jgi:hypothetical protein
MENIMVIAEKVYDGKIVRKQLTDEKWAFLQTLPKNHGWKVVEDSSASKGKSDKAGK